MSVLFEMVVFADFTTFVDIHVCGYSGSGP